MIKRILRLADAVAAEANLKLPFVSVVKVLDQEPLHLLAVKILEGSYADPATGSIYVVRSSPDLFVMRVMAAYFALALFATFGVVDLERARELARENYYRVLVRL